MTSIILARCDDFALADVTVRPSTREFVARGRSALLEPKVMQVLVALAQPPGRVVSRDELVERCWRGRVVGDDAINRVIGKLRRVAADTGAFRIETVARVGYRLAIDARRQDETGSEPASLRTDHVRPRLVHLRVLVTVAVCAALAAVALLKWAPQRGPSTQSPPREHRLPAAVTDLETRGLAAMFENTPEQTAEGVGYLQQATSLAPRAAPVWGSLAMGYVLRLGWAAPDQQATLTARVRDAAAYALRIDPHESRSAAALVSLEPTFGHWQAKADALRVADHVARPGPGPLTYQRVQFLMAVGRSHDAIAVIEELAKASPLIPWIQAARVHVLAADRRMDDAQRAADAALRIWPQERLTWFTAFDLAVFNGRPADALAMAINRAAWPHDAQPEEMLRTRRLAEAVISRDPSDIARVLAMYGARARRSQADAERAMRVAAGLNRPAAALAFARVLYADALAADSRRTMLPRIGSQAATERPTAALFQVPAQVLWTQPGFADLVAATGLPAYWRLAGPPDLCRTQPSAATCRDLAVAR